MLLDELLGWVELSVGADRAVEDNFVLAVIVQVNEMRLPTIGASFVHRLAFLARHRASSWRIRHSTVSGRNGHGLRGRASVISERRDQVRGRNVSRGTASDASQLRSGQWPMSAPGRRLQRLSPLSAV